MDVKAPQPAPKGPKPNPSPPKRFPGVNPDRPFPPPPKACRHRAVPSVRPIGKAPPMPPLPPPNETTTKGPLPPMVSRPPEPVSGRCLWCRIKAAIRKGLTRKANRSHITGRV